MDEKTVGVIKKYDVKRVDDPQGKHDDCWYFVLDPEHDPIALQALDVYCRLAFQAGYVELAADLDAVISKYE